MIARWVSWFGSGRAVVVLSSLFAVIAIVFLAISVAREMKLLRSAQSDNVQWALSQVEVEFLEFQNQITASPTDVDNLRRRFDVFYSRVTIIQSAIVFETLRSNPSFNGHLRNVTAFLDATVTQIDQDDVELIQSLSELKPMAAMIRSDVRSLANSGLKTFAQASDNRRYVVSKLMTQLAALLLALICALAIAIVYLRRIVKQARVRSVELSNAMERMDTITSTSLDAVIVSDINGIILDFNAAAETIFGHVAQEVIGLELGAVIVPDHLRELHDAGMDRMRTGGSKRVVGMGRVKLEAKHATGKIFPVELAIQTAETAEGDIFIAFLRDISAQVLAEKELVDARDTALASEKIKSDFLAIMSHEIRTPLNGLLGNMTLLRDTKLNAAQDRYLSNMETSGRMLMRHVTDVLDITRYDTGAFAARSAPMNVSVLLQDIIDNQIGAAAANETTLEWGWTGKAVNWVASDAERLQHILLNLVGNAVKFTKRGKVTVLVEAIDADEPLLRFDVIDTGPGVDVALSERIFDDFVTGNTAYDRSVGGTGLGLSIAKRFVAALDGHIGFHSAAGKGSRFWITVPLVRSKAPLVTDKSIKLDKNTARLSVLVVEDNEINRLVVREMLEAEGHLVCEAFDGCEGVEQAKVEHFDLILMDISMPVMDGRVATREIRTSQGPNAQTPIVALTANAMAEEQAIFLQDGMNAILTKPLLREALHDVLHKVSPSATKPVLQTVDVSHGAQTRETVGDAAFEKLLGRFQDEVQNLVDLLSSTDAFDMSDVAMRCHHTAGSAAVFGAVEIGHALKTIEDSARAGDAQMVNLKIVKLPDQWHRTKQALTQFLA